MMMMSLLDGSGMTGDIWSTGAFAVDSPLKDLLDSSDGFTLEQLLAEDELLQELRGLHPQLLDYFSTEDTVTKLVRYLILDPNKNNSSSSKSNDRNTNTDVGDAAVVPNDNDATEAATESSSHADGEVKEEQPLEGKQEEKESEDIAQQQQQTEGGDEKPASAEPGKWLFQHLEDSKSSEHGDGDDSVKDKHPEHNPDNKFIRFPFMACEVVCCEMQGVIDVLVDGFVPIGESSTTTNTVSTTATTSSSSTPTKDEGDEESKQQTESQPQPTTTSSSSGVEEPTATTEPSSTEVESKDSSQVQQQPESRQRILDLFFSVLYDTEVGELDDYRAGYLEKILSVLFRKRPQAMSDYMNTGGGRGSVHLMKAMFKHLYSHSIMQLVQRLLLPQLQQLQQNPEDGNGSGDENDDDDEGDDGNLILGAQAGAGMGEDNDDETKTLQCNWTESGEALDLLLQPLIYPSASPSAPTEENGSLLENVSDLSENEQERRLNLSQNSSEVLITIIQNSPLNSETMLRLTVNPIMERLVDGASCVKDGEDFSHHESNLTATMNVLESLILQLGGYGSVGTISLLPTEENAEGEDGPAEEQPPPPQFADLKVLLAHIPRLLQSLAVLLQHPSCEAWRSPMQFSEPSEPQLLLGMSRLRIVRLLESLVLLGESNVDFLLCQSDCLEICLDLFWKFQWCSMLHQSVANLLVHVFEGANARSEMQEYFLVKCNLLGQLMDSFAEVTPGEPNFSLPDDAPVPDFTEHAVVIAMKNMKLENENAPVNAPQPNDLGARTDDDAERVPTDDIIPVSDDDVDAVLDQQVEQEEAAGAAVGMADTVEGEALKEQPVHEVSSVGQISTETVRFESRDASTVGAMLDGAPPQSFRLGYMGHVIIICQALVHACSTENDEPEGTAPDSAMEDEEDEDNDRMALLAESRQEQVMMNGDHHLASSDPPPPPPPPRQANPMAESLDAEDSAGRDESESARAGDSNAEGVPPPNPLLLSKLIDNHPLETRWHEFVRSTLATETAIQSTPLGGYNNNALPGGDPLHAHRPLGDEDDFDDGSGQPNMPPRGMLGGGDFLDLDDNDLDIAASMIAGLHMAHRGGRDHDGDDDDDSDDEGGSDGSGNTYDEQAAKQRGYFFDDPLGNKRDSGLGLALGNLGQYHAGSSDEEDGSDKGSDHSSDEEEADEHPRRTNSGDDVPVMNLFAGNLSPGEEKTNEPSPFGENVWSNFANFDDAFASSEGTVAGFTADFGSADVGSAPANEDAFPSPPSGPANGDADDIFGVSAPHAILLDDAADNISSDPKGDSDPFAIDEPEKLEEESAAVVEEAEERPEGES